MKRFVILSITALAVLCVPVAVVFAQGLIPCSGDGCRACDVVKLVDNVLRLLVALSVLVATIIFIYAGFLLVTSSGNQGTIKKAKAMFVDVAIGIIIVLTGYLVVDTVMRVLVGDSLLGGGRWDYIQCVSNASVRNPGAWQPGDPGGPVVPPDPTDPGGGRETIAEALRVSDGMDTSGGPLGGVRACAWAVNQILGTAGVAPIDGDSVPMMEAALQGGRGTQVSQGQAQPGDIVIQAGKEHVGICQNVGCTSVLSNSSTNRSFSWRSGTDFAPSYSGGPGRIYRVK